MKRELRMLICSISLLFNAFNLASTGESSIDDITINSNHYYRVEIQTKIPDPVPGEIIPSVGKKYVFFRNFDPYSYLAYQQYLEQSEYKDEFLYTDFLDAFFNQYKITDFECAVFPLGNFILNASTVGGNIVIDKIMEMYNAGKKVIITGRVPLYGAYRTTQGNDPKVRNFLENILGIEYIGYRPTSDTVGTTINIHPFTVKGAPAEPITFGAAKHCNITYNGQNPLTISFNVDVFKLKQSATNSFKQDHLIEKDETPISDTLVGCRFVKDSSKIAFWSYGFDQIADAGLRSIIIPNTIKWMFREAAGEGANIELLPWERYNFGSVKLGDSAFIDVIIRNSGTKDLIISKILYGQWTDPGIFTVAGGIPKTPITIKPDAAFSFKVKFQPAKEEDYREYIEIQSNAINFPIMTAWFEGKGGTGGGAKVQLNRDTINFGDVAPLKQAYNVLTIKNTGDREVTIGDVRFLENPDNVFNFTKGTPTPTLNPGQEQQYEIRFVPQEEGKNYIGLIRIWATPINPPEIFIPIIGRGSSKSAFITVIDNLDFEGVAIGTKETKTIDIKNDGDADLVINSISLTGADANSFTLNAPDSYPFIIASKGAYNLSVDFQPTEPKKHFATVRIESNASNKPLANIILSGMGTATDVIEKMLSDGMKLQIIPNPVESAGVLIFESGNSSFSESNPISIYISNITGARIKELYKSDAYLIPDRITFDTQEMTEGIYFIVIQTGSKLIVQPFVILQ